MTEPALPRLKTCGNCTHMHRPNGRLPQLECCLNPPTPNVLLIPSPRPPGFEIQNTTVRPLVTAEMWCSQWAGSMLQRRAEPEEDLPAIGPGA